MAAPIVRGTAAWRYFGDFRASVLAGQVLVLQVAHPVVAAGVRDHSGYQADPWTRLLRTAGSLAIYVYGDPVGARYEADRLWELHKRFTGVDAEGRRYHALDPHAYAWVHATLVMQAVDTQRFFGRPLSRAELDEYYAQLREVGRRLGLRERHLPPDWPAFERYYAAMVTSFGPNETISTLFETIRTVAKPVRALPDRLWLPLRTRQYELQMFLIAATLPPVLRERLGLRWTARRQRRFERLCCALRVLGAMVPVPLRSAHVRGVGKLNVWLRRRRGLHA
ncbi:oxygenase MpaB family protein [Qaidamihabitans albus]|uniref:oxygenase MpaB family protein n=1 Tax=Qaidamihabitans albus TaxID=2795733 RepID=UPI0018F2493C|nr:oxygenase MpaB family protein [Qaidamihabitans albus]